MKNHNKVLFAGFLALLMVAVSSCKTAAAEGSVLNFIKILSVDWSFESSQDGAQLLLRNLVVRFANDTGAPVEGKVLADWGNGRTEESAISLRDTGGMEYTDAVWADIRHGDHYVFHGELTVTIKLTVQFLEIVSPVFEKTVTMRSL